MYTVSIWPRGLAINAVAAEVLTRDGPCLDAVEAALRASEDDTNDLSTGRGGLPNCAGETELDAAIMHAPSGRGGAVGALRRTRYAISVARCVMELTPHLLLVGDGAVEFARAQGFPEFDLQTEQSRQRFEAWRSQQQSAAGHDTMATVAIDGCGEIGVGVTTSGTPFKLPGRVGDSAILGAGCYANQQIGGAVATGVGEEAMRICATAVVVELMGRGVEPSDACRQALERLLTTYPPARQKQLALAALRADGRPGGAALKAGFAYAYFDGSENRLIEVAPVIRQEAD